MTVQLNQNSSQSSTDTVALAINLIKPEDFILDVSKTLGKITKKFDVIIDKTKQELQV